MEPPKILLIGATGFIGGSVLSRLLEIGIQKKCHLSVLIRGEEKVAFFQGQGVHTVPFNNLDETKILKKVASEYDIVIDTAASFLVHSAEALILGLSERRKIGKKVHYIRTSGTSNVADHPITGKYHEVNTFTDKSNVYAYEKFRDSIHPYAQRSGDITTVEKGLQTGVSTTIIMAPTIFGLGSGSFNRVSIQIPTLMRRIISAGHAFVIGNGKGVWNFVHIDDLARLYELLLLKILAGEEIPTGERGILFVENGTFDWRDLSETIAKALFTLGAIKSDNVKTIGLAEATAQYGLPDAQITELGWTSNSRTKADLARELGWKPEKVAQDFHDAILEEAKLIVAEEPSNYAHKFPKGEA